MTRILITREALFRQMDIQKREGTYPLKFQIDGIPMLDDDEIDPAQKELAQYRHHFTYTEGLMLRELLRASPNVVTNDMFAAFFRSDGFRTALENAVITRVHIRGIRRTISLNDLPFVIKTERQRGYRLLRL